MESRTLLSAAPTDNSFRLVLFADSTEVDIPAEVGVQANDSTESLFTVDGTGEVYLDTPNGQKLGDFFDIWQNSAGLAGNRPDAILNENQLLSHIEDGDKTVQMFVNGQVSTEFEEYAVQDGDEIVLVYGSNPVLSLNTNYGPIVLELFAGPTPITVNNFLNYVNDGDYIDSFFHRSVSNFVIQGGGFTTTSATFTDTDQFSSVPTDAAIQNEPGIHNVRGTVAMAKSPTGPDTATSQFFVNIADNSGNLDSQNGGFTVFAQVLDMTTVDEIAALPITSAASIDQSISADDASLYSSLPLGSNDQLVVVESVTGQGEVSGVKYLDENENGAYDSGEQLLSGATIYLDANDNGILDSGETWAITGTDGSYRFQVEAGDYIVRSELNPGRLGTEPVSPDSYSVAVKIGREEANLNFGEIDLPAPSGIDLLAVTDTGTADDDNLTRRDNGDQASTLQFLVSGVADGAEVQVFADGTLIGSAVAAGSTVTVTTDGVHALNDGAHSIVAVQVLGGTSDPSDPLEITIDSTPPGGLTNQAPETGQFDVLYSYDADSPDEGDVTYSLENAPSGMTVNASTGAIAWTPSADQTGPQTFDVVITDPAGNTTSQTLSLTVLGAIPAYPDEYTVDEDTTLSKNATDGVLHNDDTTSGTLEVAVYDLPSHGNLTLHSDGSFVYTPFANFSGTDTFTYFATAGPDESNVAPVTITINPVNDAPVGIADAYTTSEDTVLTRTAALGVLVNDSDIDGDNLSALLVDQASHGTVMLNSDGSFTYTPNGDYHGDDSFTYKINDGTADSEPVTVSLTVTAVNDPPATQDDSYVVDEDAILTVTAADGVLKNDSDVDSESFTAVIASEPANGSVTFENDGSFVYTPDANFFGTDTFTYRATDGSATSGATTVTITVNGTPDDPTAVNDTFTAPNDGTSVLIDVLANDTSAPDGAQALSITSVTQGSAGGTVSIENNQLRYTAKAGTVGQETIDYTITDSDGLTDTATVTVTVVDASDNTLSGFVHIDTDGDGTRDGGEMGIPGVLITLTGTDNFGNTVSRTALTSNDGSYVFDQLSSGTYQLVERQPAALADGEDSSPLAGAVVGNDVISNLVISDSGVFGDNNFGEAGLLPQHISIKIFLASAPPIEEILREIVGQVESLAGYAGLAAAIHNGDTTYDGGDNSSPSAADDAYSVDEDTTLNITASTGVLANDTDADGNALDAVLVTDVSHGSLTLDSNGSFSYTPDTDFNGTDSFTYLASDGLANSAVKTVTITVNSVNDAPVASNDSYDVAEGATATINTASGVLANDSDVDGDSLAATVVSDVNHGTLSLDANGSFTYTPESAFHGTDTFTYKANDGTADSAVATVTINVDALPAVAADAYSVDEDEVLTVSTVDGVLANDSDADGNTLTVSVVAQPTNGSVSLDPSGSFTYTPDADFSGTDTFKYKANDGIADSPEATVTVTVNPINDAPSAVGDAYNVTADSSLTMNAAGGVLKNDTDADGDTLSATKTTSPAHGTLTFNADGSFSYVPISGFQGTDTFKYKANDGLADSGEVTVTLTVRTVNTAPVAATDGYDVEADTTLTVDKAEGLLANDTDNEGDALTAVIVTQPAHGSVDLNADGSFSYVPEAGYHGNDSFVYQVNDGKEDSSEALVTIFVNAPPEVTNDSYSVDEDETLAVNAATGVLANDTDADGQTLSATVITQPAHGTLNFSGNGSFTYTPDTNYSGSDSFTYVANDGFGNSVAATAGITVNPINDAPQAIDDTYDVPAEGPLTVDAASGVAVNDVDADGDPLEVNLVSGPAHGAVVIDKTGAFTFTPNASFESTDSFTYTVNDGTVDSPAATVTLNAAAQAALADQALADEQDWV